MKQNLEELIYLREEEAMNIELSLNQFNIMKKYWKEFKNYCIDKNINHFEFNQINLYLNDYYNCLLVNNKQTNCLLVHFITWHPLAFCGPRT